MQSSLSHGLLHLAAKLCGEAVNTMEIFIARGHSMQPVKYTPSCELNCECCWEIVVNEREHSGSCEWVAVYYRYSGSLLYLVFSNLCPRRNECYLHLFCHTSLDFQHRNFSQAFAGSCIFREWKHDTLLCKDLPVFDSKGKGKAVPLQAWGGPETSRKLKFPDFMTTAQDGGKFVGLTHRPPLPPGNKPEAESTSGP